MTTLIFLLEALRDWAAFAWWQSFLFLGSAVVAERFFRRSPWSAHLMLTLAIFASVLVPTASFLIFQSGGGVISPGSIFALEKQSAGIPSLLATAILFGGSLFLLLFLYGVISARRLMFQARPFPDRESQEALLEGSRMMHNVSLPVLFTSPAVKSPTVWSWGLHPAVLLPETLSKTLSPEERDAIFLHELAHITRRDHWAALLNRLCGVLLFWNPLYWIALKLSDLAADRACDLLVLSREKVSPEAYGETLLRLAAGEKNRPVLQYLSRKELLMKRIDTILDFEENRDQYSVTRTALKTIPPVIGILMLATVLAFCQEKAGPEKYPFTAPENRLTHLVTFEPAGDFAPKIFDELHDVLYPAMAESGVKWMFTKMERDNEGKQIFLCLTDDPEKVRAVIDTLPQLKFVKSERLTKESYENHTASWKNRSEKPDAVSHRSSLPTPRLLEIEKSDWFQNLNEFQKEYTRWDEKAFVADYNLTLPEDKNELKTLEKKWIERLEGEEPVRTEYNGTDGFTKAIVGLTMLKSPKAKELLANIAGERVLKDNAYRHTATKMLGELGDPAAIPDLIPLVYHFNFNTRADAQISLVRLTGQNFGNDAAAWGKWYNDHRGKLGKDLSEFDPTTVDWSCGENDAEIRFYSDPKNQKDMDEAWLQRQGGKQLPKSEPEKADTKHLRSPIWHLDQEAQDRPSHVEIWNGKANMMTMILAMRFGGRKWLELSKDQQKTLGFLGKLQELGVEWFRKMHDEQNPELIEAEQAVMALIPKDDPTFENATEEQKKAYIEASTKPMLLFERYAQNIVTETLTPEQLVKLRSLEFTALPGVGESSPHMFDSLGLSEDQQKKVEAIKKEFEPEFLELLDEQMDLRKEHLVLYTEGKNSEEDRKDYNARYKEQENRRVEFAKRLRERLESDVLTEEQRTEAKKRADDIPGSLKQLYIRKEPEKVRSYRVDKKVSEFPEDQIDLSTPEAAYALSNRIIAGDEPDKLASLQQYTVGRSIPGNIKKWVESMSAEDRKKTGDALILKVFVYKAKGAMVVAEIDKDKRYNTRMFLNENGRWFNVGGSAFFTGKSDGPGMKTYERAFMATVERWDAKKPEEVWKTPDQVGHTHLVVFEPADPFEPKNAQELLDKLNEHLFKRNDILTGYFRTHTDEKGKLVGRICTNNPSRLGELIETIPELKLVKTDSLNQKTFEEHIGKTIVDPEKVPKIAKMEPENGAKDVDAEKTTELRVTFDRDMNTGGFSWCGGGEDFPGTEDETPRWIDKRTCVLPVKLVAGKTYRLSINAPSFKNFQSADGVPVEPTPYSFTTIGATETEKTAPPILPPMKDVEKDAKPLPDGLLKTLKEDFSEVVI